MGPNLPLFTICFLLSIPDISIGRKPKEPEIISTPTTLQLQKGKKAVFECAVENLGDRHIVWRRGYDVTGNPHPTVIWTKEGSGHQLPGVQCDGGHCVQITGVQKSDGGAYKCTASNGVGESHSASIYLTVQYKPRIEQDHGSKNYVLQNRELTLECIIESEPAPTVAWYKDLTKLTTGQKVNFKKTGSSYKLILKERPPMVFGNYSCQAENLLGESRKFFEVHGRPFGAQFTANHASYHKQRFELSWSVESSVPILEYRLLYRRLAKASQVGKYEGEDWTNVIIPGTDQDSISNSKTMSWDLEGLKEESNYEAIVQARNMYGWSEPSSMFSFNTSIPITKQGGVTYSLNWSLGDGQSGQGQTYLSTLLLLLATLLALYQ